MHKLPVYATSACAYRFLLAEAGTILRLSWFPLLIVTILQYLTARTQFAAMRSALEAGDLKALSGLTTWHWQLLSAAATILGTAVVAVALHRVILFGQRQPGRFIHLAFGKVEMLFALLPIILLLPIVLISAVVFGLTAAVAGAMVPAIFLIVVVLLWGAMIFVVARLSAIFPLTVIEGRYDFGQAWSLTRGNFWRIAGVWIVALVPLLVVVVVIAVLTSPFPAPGKAGAMVMLELIESRLLLQTIFSYVWSIVAGALGVAVLSYSYKALIGRHPDDVWIPES